VANAKGRGQLVNRHNRWIAASIFQATEYCWLNPEISANFSWVRPLFRLIRLTFRPTNLRMSMRKGQRITSDKFINYNM
jgi:hypothetical protein